MLIALTLLILWPLAELYVAIQVAGVIGALATILLLIAGWPLGRWALRSQGSLAWRRLSEAVAERRAPGREVLNGALVLAGGVLLMVPGFIGDVLGILLLAPPTRAVLRGLLARNLQSRLVRQAVRFGRGAQHYDVDSTAQDIEPPRLPR